jgi:hypothetical protein
MRLLILFLVATVAATPRTVGSQDVDSTLMRIERLVVAGDRSSARVLTDSLIATLAPESPRLADALYWRAQSSRSAVDAERDYLRIAVEHPFTARAPDALMALAQLEYARGNRGAARRRFDLLIRDYPSGRHVARASLWSGRLAIEDGDHPAGCATLTGAAPQISRDDVELRNQFDYFLAQCQRFQPAIDSSAAAAAEQAASPATATRYSVQLAAYSTREDATALATRLKARGYDVRIVGESAPYRVRVGRYPTRAEALATLNRLRGQGLPGIVVEAERP